MHIRNLLLEQQRKLFVGRKEELRLLTEVHDNPGIPWRLLNIYGQSGIGKSTLLRLFAEKIGDNRCLYIDGHTGFKKPEDLLKSLLQYFSKDSEDAEIYEKHSLEIVITAINQYAVEQRGFFLLFDTFEQFGMIEDWLRTQFLVLLHPNVKICFAGRYPLEGAWFRDGWYSLIHNIRIKPLSSTEITEFAQSFRIHDPDIHTALIRFSRGLPLAMSIACEIIARQGKSEFLNNTEQQQVISSLVTELMKDIKQADFQHYYEVATVVWRLDQDLLQTILGAPVSSEQFYEFCKLPFITHLDQYWMLHDSIRQWGASDLQTRKPETYQRYRERAMAALLEREKYSADKMEFMIDKIYLHENEYIHRLNYSLMDEIVLRECKEAELVDVEQLFIKFLTHKNILGKEDVSLVELLRPLWHIDPSSIIGLWRNTQLIAFCTRIPLNHQTVEILKQHPTTAHLIERINIAIPHYLIHMAGFEPNLDEEISGCVTDAFVRLLTKQAIYIDLLMSPDWAPLMPLLGFERAAWGDAISSEGTKYECYQIDLREDNFVTRIERNAALQRNDTYTTQVSPIATFDETIPLVKQVFKHYNDLHGHKDIVQSLYRLLFNTTDQVSIESAIYQLQQLIEDMLEQMANKSDEDQRLSKMIRYAYIERIGPHEMIAERMNISIPTYYRHLKKGIHRFVFLLLNPHANSNHP